MCRRVPRSSATRYACTSKRAVERVDAPPEYGESATKGLVKSSSSSQNPVQRGTGFRVGTLFRRVKSRPCGGTLDGAHPISTRMRRSKIRGGRSKKEVPIFARKLTAAMGQPLGQPTKWTRHLATSGVLLTFLAVMTVVAFIESSDRLNNTVVIKRHFGSYLSLHLSAVVRDDSSTSSCTIREWHGTMTSRRSNFFPNARCHDGEASDFICLPTFMYVCAVKRDSEPPSSEAELGYWEGFGNASLDIVGGASKCFSQPLVLETLGTSCQVVGRRLKWNYTVANLSLNTGPAGSGLPASWADTYLVPDLSVANVESQLTWRPKTFLINCAKEFCFNFFHSLIAAYYHTFVAMKLLGLQDLSDYEVIFLEDAHTAHSGSRQRHALFLTIFKPAGLKFTPYNSTAHTQPLGCFKELVFVGHDTYPWSCYTNSTSVEPMLLEYAHYFTSALGYSKLKHPPIANHVLYLRRPSGVRGLANGKEIMQEFANFNISHSVWEYDKKRSEEENIHSMLKEMRKASIIFGRHGASFTNVIFASPYSVVIEVLSGYHKDPRMYRNLAVATKKIYIEEVSRPQTLPLTMTTFCAEPSMQRFHLARSPSSHRCCKSSLSKNPLSFKSPLFNPTCLHPRCAACIP